MAFGDIAENVSAYVNGVLPFERFLEWFVPVAWMANTLSDQRARKLVRRIEIEWSEFARGHSNKQELDDALRVALEQALSGPVRGSIAARPLPGVSGRRGANGRSAGNNVEAHSRRLLAV